MTKQSEILNNPKYIPVLNAGFVGLVDHMGNDDSIVQAARVSYGKGTKKVSEDRGLIRYLVRHSHTTPLEMVEFKFHCQMPIFVARQWIRHRTASVNEYSGRYSEMSDDMFVPELSTIKPQSNSNKQGRDGEFSESQQKLIQTRIIQNNKEDQDEYKLLLDTGMAKEMARGVLSVNNYTEWYWKIDLHNLFHFLKLRMDAHAQYEIRVFADAMYELIKPIVPIACEAFEDYIFDMEDRNYHNYKLSKQELNALRAYIAEDSDALEYFNKITGLGSRELEEFKKKFRL
jgi:thymidylate synthase (FAD)